MDLQPVIYSFKERFTYGLNPDSTWYGTLGHFRQLYPDSTWAAKLSEISNEQGTLAWQTSQDMLALVVLYDQTGDLWFLRWLERYCEAVIAARDDLSGKKDCEGLLLPGWGSSRYGDSKRKVYLVHSGLILEPILEYALRAAKLPDRSAADDEKLKKLVEHCRETLLWHDSQLDPESPPGEAVYLSGGEEPERRHAWQPFNRQNVLARDFYLLFQLTGDETYRERSRKLYTFFRDHIERTPSDAYVWEYEQPRFVQGPPKVIVCEDVSHASYSIEPVVHACRDGFVFEPADLHRFARTFTKYIHLGNGILQTSIGCRPSFSPMLTERFYAWLPLAQADPHVYWLLRRFLMHNVEKPQPLAIAYLIAYRPKGMAGVDTRVH